jgi:hypothetical protein
LYHKRDPRIVALRQQRTIAIFSAKNGVALLRLWYNWVMDNSTPATTSLPAGTLYPGMVTSDGQTVLDVEETESGLVIYHVFTDCDDPDELEQRKAAPEARAARFDAPVSVFSDSVPIVLGEFELF